ncbi:MAG: mevalonate kinase [Gammaproteobacteria bacterium]|nr:mevalonate kinase [Gammaproteobacteria bacterium]
MKIRAPGKLILSGEHAVVYGAPALAMAVNRYVEATARSQTLPLISFDLSDLAYHDGLTLTALKRLKSRIRQQYQRFVSGERRIRDVLKKSHELAQFAFTLFLESLNLRLTEGVKIHLQSDIPVGCGMGSSAATILGVTHAVAHFLKKEFSSDYFYRLALEAENMQHGHSSGLDLKVCLQGGALFAEQGQFEERPIPTLSFYLVHTGIPQTTTGECVAHVAHHFAERALIDAFSDVTRALDEALKLNHFENVAHAIRQNHALLSRIGVVPENIQHFIRDVELLGHAAKICGAGAVSGQNAGIILVAARDIETLSELCARYRYAVMPVSGEARGVHVI